MARPIAKRRRAGSSQRCDLWLFAPRKSEPANRRAGTSCAFRVCGVATTTTTAPARTVAACGALSFRSRSSFDLRHPCSGDRGFWSETDSNPLSSLKKNPLVETVCSTFQACPFRGTEGSNPSRSSEESANFHSLEPEALTDPARQALRSTRLVDLFIALCTASDECNP